MISSLILGGIIIGWDWTGPYVEGQLDQHTFPCKAVPCQSVDQSTGETTEQQKSFDTLLLLVVLQDTYT